MKRWLKKGMAFLGYEVCRKDTSLGSFVKDVDRSHLSYALTQTFASPKNLRFLQIGANDGHRNDPIAHLIDRHHWSGVFVEPDPLMMSQLQHRRSGIRFVHIPYALAPTTGFSPFYSLGGEGLPDFANGLGTLSRERIEEAAKDLAEFRPTIVQREMECISVPDLLAKVGYSDFDVCVMDVEGLDFEILQLLIHNGASARIIHYEYKCLSNEDRNSSFSFLLKADYNLLISEEDCTAYRRP